MYYAIYSDYRGKEEEDADMQDLSTSFSGLEEKVLAQYTFAKVLFVTCCNANLSMHKNICKGKLRHLYCKISRIWINCHMSNFW